MAPHAEDRNPELHRCIKLKMPKLVSCLRMLYQNTQETIFTVLLSTPRYNAQMRCQHMALIILQGIQYQMEYTLSESEIWTTTLQTVKMYPNELPCTTYRFGCH